MSRKTKTTVLNEEEKTKNYKMNVRNTMFSIWFSHKYFEKNCENY